MPPERSDTTSATPRARASDAWKVSPPESEALRWLRAPLMREGLLTEARLYRADLPNGDRLIVGRDVEEIVMVLVPTLE